MLLYKQYIIRPYTPVMRDTSLSRKATTLRRRLNKQCLDSEGRTIRRFINHLLTYLLTNILAAVHRHSLGGVAIALTG